ncbi:MAG: Ser-Thr-rich GPI-anchored membrane family protein, partial [Cyclobacteriaceae bacterium]
MATTIAAQDINIQSVSIDQGKVTMKFTLEDPNPDRRYTLRLYSSMDNYVQPLQNVSGNIGVDQLVGGNKQIVWDASKELKPGFNDYISFELRAFIYVPFIEMEDLSQYGVFKRGKAYTLKWSGGRGDNILSFELFRGDKKTGTLFKDVANTGSWSMTLPNNTKPGRDYYFKITDQNNNDEQVNTGLFTVKARVPL